jgi:hypothetical protein
MPCVTKVSGGILDVTKVLLQVMCDLRRDLRCDESLYGNLDMTKVLLQIKCDESHGGMDVTKVRRGAYM